MCPEKVLLPDEKQKIFGWLLHNEESKLRFVITGREKGSVSLTYMVGDEHLTIIQEKPLDAEITLFCSDKQAKQLKEAGIVKFPESQPKK